MNVSLIKFGYSLGRQDYLRYSRSENLVLKHLRQLIRQLLLDAHTHEYMYQPCV
jgi:hypothetical protein